MPKNQYPYFYFFVILSLPLLFVAISLNLNSYLNQPQPKVLSASIDVEQAQAFWEKVVNENPTYSEGIIALAKLEIDSGNQSQALLLIEKLESIDPNNGEIKKLRRRLVF